MIIQKRKGVLNYTILIGLLLIPFMSLPVMPSDYRPVSIYFLIPPAIIVYLKYVSTLKIREDIFLLSIFLLFASIQSIVLLEDLVKSLRSIAPLFIGVFSYIAMVHYLKFNNVEKLYNKFLYLFILISVIGVIEILSMHHILPYEFKVLIGEIFSTKVSSRIQLITMEGSWAAKIIIFAIPIYFYYYSKNGYFYKSFYTLLLIFIFIFSLEGVAIILLAWVVYILIRLFPIIVKLLVFRYRIKVYIYSGLFIFITILIIQLVMNTQSGYAISRIYKFTNSDSILSVLSLDGSTFIRVVYPYIGFLIFLDQPLGVGMGGYAQAFNHYINFIPIDYSNFSEVVGDINTISADPKMLYAKLISETGIIGIFLFVCFMVLHFKYLRFNIKNLKRYKLFFIVNFLLTVTSVIQFGSFAYLPFWFGFAINASFYYNLKSKIENEKNITINK